MQVLLLDEITVDMDVVGRLDLLQFFVQVCGPALETSQVVGRPTRTLQAPGSALARSPSQSRLAACAGMSQHRPTPMECTWQRLLRWSVIGSPCVACTQECEQRGATIIYATHIFDGLEPWITHLAYVASGRLQRGVHGWTPALLLPTPQNPENPFLMGG